MNIWYFHHYATPYSIPGLHRPFEFGEHWVKEGNRVAVFTSSYLHYSGKNIITNGVSQLVKNYDGVDAVYIKTRGYSNFKLDRVINMIQFGYRLLASAKWYAKNNWKPDVIVASSPHPFTMLAGLLVAKKFNIPCVCEVRDFWPEVFFLGGVVKEEGIIGKALLRGERFIYEKADKLVFLKEGDHTYITDHKWDIGHGGKIDMNKCYYVNNGVDINLFDERSQKECPEEVSLDKSKFNVVYCGTIRPINNIGMLLDVAKLVDKNIMFYIYGTGNCVNELKQRIIDENIENVIFKGYVDNKYIPAILKEASITMLNYSGTEYNWSRGNSSNKLFEYLAAGKPVISNIKMGYDILEKYKAGLSAKEYTAESVAESIQKIYDMTDKEYIEMGENARKASEKFNITALAKKYIEIIKR